MGRYHKYVRDITDRTKYINESHFGKKMILVKLPKYINDW